MPDKIHAVRGMNDVLPAKSPLWELLEDAVRDVFRQYGYRNIRTPMVERTELFVRGVGQATDIVEKEMYSFVDAMNGDNLSLRPEGTAPTVRAVLEHNLLYNGPQRLWYSGPLFRHERPQKGRYRQYHTFGAEALGFPGPEIDVELLMMARRLWQRLNLDGVQLQINTIGSAEERRAFRDKLIAYFERHQELLDDDAKRRLHANPLRILDSKNPAMQAMIEAAPKLIDAVGRDSRANFEAVQAGLDVAGIPFSINPRLVRGLDYYNLTVFEWVSDRLGAQSAVCSGGRYDGLCEQLGGKPTPGCGFGIGVERTLLLLDAHHHIGQPAAPDAYLVHQGAQAARFAFVAAERLRDYGLTVIYDCSGGSFKSQMKKADASGARHAVIVGDDEAQMQHVSVKPLREAGEQTRCALERAAELIKTKRG
ncbi:MAG: histidine--tRNA ligase [Betaproteobacteria bacterium]|nr:histidine--tRNA ligase [Betaproteobacteria bacterium]MBI3054720.1 histidine--tRNA ligase [Betaproteobacteria bacterium]